MMMWLAERCFDLLLRAYPRAYRREFGHEIALTCRDGCRDAYARRGSAGLSAWWACAALDLLVAALRQHLAMARRRDLRSLLIALAAGGGVGYVNTHNAEVQAPMLCLLMGTCALGLLWPDCAWRWSLLLGGAIPLSQTLALLCGAALPYANDWGHIASSLFVLIPATIGAYVGAALGRPVRGRREAVHPGR
jgi:hypothetical protein